MDFNTDEAASGPRAQTRPSVIPDMALAVAWALMSPLPQLAMQVALISVDPVAEQLSSTNKDPGGDPEGHRSLENQCGPWLWQDHRPRHGPGCNPGL